MKDPVPPHARVWITGASSGIGAALVPPLVEGGARVAIRARRRDLLEQVASPYRDRVVAVPCDVTDRAGVAEAIDAVVAALGGIDLAIFNAGGTASVRVESFSTDPYRQVFALNYFGVLDALEGVLPVMRTQGGGHVAVIASASAYAAIPSMSAYGASKAALAYTMEALRPELARWHIDVSVVYPGFVRTPLTAQNRRMPFLLEVDDAASRILAGLAARRPEIDFPRRLTWAIKGAQRLPAGLRRRLFARLIPRRGVLPE